MARRWQVTAGFGAAVIALGLLAGTAAAVGQAVTIANFAFAPGTITVTPGTTVTWTNNDSATHTATGTGFDTGSIAPGASAAFTFTTAGSFAYHCAIHPAMTGSVVVQAAGAAATPRATAPSTDTAAAIARIRPASGSDPTPLLLIGVAGVLGLGLGIGVAGRPSRGLGRRTLRARRDDERAQPKR